MGVQTFKNTELEDVKAALTNALLVLQAQDRRIRQLEEDVQKLIENNNGGVKA